MPAAYDAIADWYETEFLAAQADADPIGTTAALTALLGPAPDDLSPACLEIGCGTGAHAATVRGLGWTPVGVDLSSGMLAHAAGRLAVAIDAGLVVERFAEGGTPTPTTFSLRAVKGVN